MLSEMKPPFPKRTACKECASKPCQWFLKTYNEPGKFMIVSPHDFISIPCFTPSFEEGSNNESEVLTDEIEVIEGTISVTNPRWEHKDVDKKQKTPDKASLDDTVILMADITNYPDGAAVTFDIYDMSSNPPQRIDTAKGKNEKGVGNGEWVVTDKNNRGKELQLSFEAIARSKASAKKEIKLTTVFIIHLEIDTDDPAAKNDELILQDENGAEVMKLNVGDMKEISEDVVCVSFPDIDMGKKYSLIRDYGSDEEGGHDPLFINMSPNEINELFNKSEETK